MSEATQTVAKLDEAAKGAPPVEFDEGNVDPLLRMALQNGASVETLERLVALQERVADRNARMSFVRAMADFQAEVGPILKTHVIPDNYGNERSRFAPLNVIADAIREPLAKHGLSYSWDSQDDGEFTEVRCTVRHVDGHTESASFKCRTKDAAAPKMSGVQISGSARTYGMRYSLVQALGLTTAEQDNDGNVQGPTERITKGQLADLESLIEEVGANRKKFLEWLKVEELADLAASRLSVAVRELEDYRRKKAELEAKKKGGKEGGK